MCSVNPQGVTESIQYSKLCFMVFCGGCHYENKSMKLINKRLLLLLLYVLLMQGCSTLSSMLRAENRQSGDKNPPHRNGSDHVVTTTGTPISQPQPAVEDAAISEQKVLPCQIAVGKDKFGVRYYYRQQDEHGGAGFFKRLSNEEKLSTGDEYFVRFVLEAECYVYVYLVEDDTVVTDLVKEVKRGLHEAPFEKSKRHSLPSDDKGAFLLKEGGGRKVTIYFLAFDGRNWKLEGQYDGALKKTLNSAKTSESQEIWKPFLERLKRESENFKGLTVTFSVTDSSKPAPNSIPKIHTPSS